MVDDTRDQEDGRLRQFSRRALILGGLQACAVTALGARLFQLQVIEGEFYGPRADSNRFGIQFLAPRRGRILDRSGQVLADNRESFRAVLIPSVAGDMSAALRAFSRIVPIDKSQLEKITKRAKQQSRFLPVILADDLSYEDFCRLNVLAPQLAGVSTDIAWRRWYWEGDACAHVVGYVGGTEVSDVENEPHLRLPGMRVGKAGIEAAAEGDLRGRGGTQKIEVDAAGHIVRNLERVEPSDGADIISTVDIALQRRIAQRLLLERRAAAVVLDVRDGEILSLVSSPSFDPDTFAEGRGSGGGAANLDEAEAAMFNRCVSGEYPPASTFKLVTALAALEAGIIKPEERLRCRGSHRFADRTFRCWRRRGHGRVDLNRALTESCDAYFYQVASRLGIEAIGRMASRLGFGTVFADSLGEQRAGLIPDPDWKFARKNEKWYGGETLLAAIGQGQVLATPLQLAVMTARIATGQSIAPRVTTRSTNLMGGQSSFPPLDINQTALEAVREAMFTAVNGRNGTGIEASLGHGQPVVCGKTGTAQVKRAPEKVKSADVPWQDRDHALFVGYMPAENPKYALAVIIEHGGDGSKAAAPLAREIFEALLLEDPMEKQFRAPPSHSGGTQHTHLHYHHHEET